MSAPLPLTTAPVPVGDTEPVPRSAERHSQPIATASGGGTAEQFHHFR
jgi:hypothetical protein